MRLLGHILLWVGFLAGALSAVFRLEISGTPWQTVPWIWYAAAMAVGVAGVVLLRSKARESESASAASQQRWESLERNLGVVRKAMHELRESQAAMTPEQIVAFIDDRCVEPLAAFADARHALVKRVNLQFYADVMTPFASAERYINRAWSAGADGYVDEVAACIDRAGNYLDQAHELMARAGVSSP